jgi:hypothetical protein
VDKSACLLSDTRLLDEIINRKDNKFGAGGVLIAVKNTILASPVNDLDTGCEIVWARIEIANKKPVYWIILQNTIKR